MSQNRRFQNHAFRALIGVLLAASPTLGSGSTGNEITGRGGLAWNGAPKVEVDNLKILLASDAANDLVARNPSLKMLQDFDRDSHDHRYIAGAMDQNLPTLMESPPDHIREMVAEDPQTTAVLVQNISDAYRLAAPRAASAARRIADEILADVRGGKMEPAELVRASSRLKLYDLYGSPVSNDEKVREVHALAGAALAKAGVARAARSPGTP